MKLELLVTVLLIITIEACLGRRGRRVEVEHRSHHTTTSSPILITHEAHHHHYYTNYSLDTVRGNDISQERGGRGGRGGREYVNDILPSAPPQRFSQSRHNSSILHVWKRINKRRRTRIKWKHKQERGGERAGGVRVVVEAGMESGPLPHFWRSTGLSPPLPHSSAHPFLLSPDERLNLAMIGALPHDAIQQVRIHWLLGLVNATLAQGSPLYNFTQLDALMIHLHQHRLRPGFELMGNPGGVFTDLENATQVLWWRHLVRQTASRYVERFGLDWVSSWRWETWNEPDHHDFDNLTFTVQGFLNYFEACRDGLNDVSLHLRLGGPGGSCRAPSYSRICWAMLHYCDRRAPSRCLDYISIHKKGQEEADSILTQELLTAAMVRRNFPNLRHVPLVNDEGDFLKGWWRGVEWRADTRYAALVVRAVAIHLPALTPLRYELISFDNAFLNYRPSFFDQRTLVARFQMNSTSWRHIQLVKKPSYTVMGLLSLLGDRTMHHHLHGLDARMSIIASCRHCPSKIASSPNQESHDYSSEDQTSDDATETDLDLHDEPDDIPIERQSEEEFEETKERIVDEEEVGHNRKHEEKEMEEGRTYVHSSFLTHNYRESTISPVSSQSHQNTRLRTQAIRKQVSPIDVNLREENGPPREEDTAEGDEDLARLPRSEEDEDERGGGRGGEENNDAGAENAEIKESNGDKKEQDGRIVELYIDTAKTGNSERSVNDEEMEENVEMKESEENLQQWERKEEKKDEEDSREAWEATVLVSLSDGPAKSPPALCRKVTVEVEIPDFLIGGVVFSAVYRLGGRWPGPYEAWLQLGQPEEPTRPELAFMRAYENARRQGPFQVAVTRPSLEVATRLCVPDVWLLHLCRPFTASPGQVVGVGVMAVTPWDALVTWSDERISTRCVLRYEVERSVMGRAGPYLRVSHYNITDNNFWYAIPKGQRTVQGWYRVRVITYWGLAGPYSLPAYHRPPSHPRPGAS